MTSNLLLFYYYYRYKQSRQTIKNIIDIDDDIAEAKNRLDQIIVENDNYIDSNNIPKNDDSNFSSLDNMSLHHAKLHLDDFVNTGQSHQKPAAVRALEDSQ